MVDIDEAHSHRMHRISNMTFGWLYWTKSPVCTNTGCICAWYKKEPVFVHTLYFLEHRTERPLRSLRINSVYRMRPPALKFGVSASREPGLSKVCIGRESQKVSGLSWRSGRKPVATVQSKSWKSRKLKYVGQSLAKSGSSSLRITHVYRTYNTKREANPGLEVQLSFGILEWDTKLERGGGLIFLEVWLSRSWDPKLDSRDSHPIHATSVLYCSCWQRAIYTNNAN